jgi:uncharacterized protein YbcI
LLPLLLLSGRIPGAGVEGKSTVTTEVDPRLAISNAITKLHREHYGRGAAFTRTVYDRDYVVVFLHDIYTTVERTLIDDGQFDAVRATRRAFQRTLGGQFSAAVEEHTGRRVVAFMSEVHVNPDVSAELFVLERPDSR